MYEIKYNDNYIYVPGDKDYVAIAPILELKANRAGSLVFSIMDTHPLYGDLEKLKLSVSVLKDDDIIFKGRIVGSERNFDNEVEMTVEGKLAVLNDSPCRPHEFTGTPEELFEWFINNHNSQVSEEQQFKKGTVTVTDPNNYINRSWDKTDNTWNLINSRLLDTLGGYLVVRYEEDGDYLDWIKEFTDYSEQSIEFAENLTDFEQLVDAEETYTACIPYGAEIINYEYGEVDTEDATWEEDTYYTLSGEIYTLIESESAFNTAVSNGTTIYELVSSEATGQLLTIESVNDGKDYLINESRASLFGVIYAPADLTTWDDVTLPENLLEKSTDWLNNTGIMLKETIELSAVDLATAGVDINAFEMYKNVSVKSEPHGIDTTRLTTSLTIALDLSEVTKVVLGNSRLTLSAQNVAVKKKVEKIDNMALNVKDGEDGRSVTSVDVQYYLSTSNTSLTGGSWSTEAPEWVDGKYMWSKTVVTYSTGNPTESDPVCITGAKGKDGEGTKGKDGVGVVSIVEQYYQSTSATALLGGIWSTSVPDWTDGKYVWTRSVITYTEGDPDTTDPICVTGGKGATGDTGIGISSITNYYLATSAASGVTTNTSGWTTTVQTVTADKKYLWNYEVIAYTKGNPTTTTPCIIGTYAKDGDKGVGIASITEYYQRSTSNSTEPTSWATTPPTLTDTYKYLWNYEVIKYTDNSEYVSKKRVIGVYGDKGATGATGTSIKSVVTEYCLSNSNTSAPADGDSGWSSTHPGLVKGVYLWVRNRVTYQRSDGTTYDEFTSVYCDDGWKTLTSWCATNDQTLIDGGKIYTNSIKANQIDLVSLFAQDITATGKITAHNADIEGTVVASKGAFGPFVLTDTGLRVLNDDSNWGTNHRLFLYSEARDHDNGDLSIQPTLRLYDYFYGTKKEGITDIGTTFDGKSAICNVTNGGYILIGGNVELGGIYRPTYNGDSLALYSDIADSGWIALSLNSQFTTYSDGPAPRVRRIGKMVELIGTVTCTSSITGGVTEHTMFTLPDGYHPKYERVFICQGSSTNIWNLRVKTNGAVSFSRYRSGDTYSATRTDTWLPFNVSFFTN